MAWWGALLLTLVAAGGTLAALALGAAVRSATGERAASAVFSRVALDPLNLAFAQAIGFGAALALGLRLYRRGTPIADALGIRSVPWAALALAFVAGLALQFPLSEVANLAREVVPVDLDRQLRIQQLLRADDPVDGLAIGLAFVLVAPVAEEGLFRGLLLPSLEQRYGGRVAVVLSSALFGLSHGAPVTAVYSAAAGLLLALLVLRVDSLLPAMALHAGVNAMPVLLPSHVLPIRGFNVISKDVYHLPLPLFVGSVLVAGLAFMALLRVADEETR